MKVGNLECESCDQDGSQTAKLILIILIILLISYFLV